MRRTHLQKQEMRPFAAFVAAVFSGNKVLVVQNRDRGYWMMPGGGIEPGEAPVVAARREFFEETGCRIRADEMLHPVLSGDSVDLYMYMPSRVMTQATFRRRTDVGETSDYGFVDVTRSKFTVCDEYGNPKACAPTQFRRHTPGQLRGVGAVLSKLKV